MMFSLAEDEAFDETRIEDQADPLPALALKNNKPERRLTGRTTNHLPVSALVGAVETRLVGQRRMRPWFRMPH